MAHGTIVHHKQFFLLPFCFFKSHLLQRIQKASVCGKGLIKPFSFFSGGFSVLVPHLDLLISLVGAFASSFLAFIFPPFIELVTFDSNKWTWMKNVTIILIGFVGFLTGTYASMKEIVKTF